MSFIIETGAATSADAISQLLKEWASLRETKKEEELRAPEWQTLEQAYVAHLLWRFQYPKQIFGQQLIANWIITAVVLILVLSGLVFSFIQLNYALSLGDLTSLKTSVEVETAGKVSISSSIVGAITLVISLAFFALYLKYVFQIKHPVPPHVSISETDATTVLAALGGSKRKTKDDEVKVVSIHQG